MAAFAEVGGGIIARGSAFVMVPAMTSGSCSDLRISWVVSVLSAALFLYGWIWRRKNVIGTRSKRTLYELAHFLRRAQLSDKRITLSVSIVWGELEITISEEKAQRAHSEGDFSYGNKESDEGSGRYSRTVYVDDYGVLHGH